MSLAKAIGLKYEADIRTMGFLALWYIAAPILWFYHEELGYYSIALWLLVCHLSFVSAVSTHNAMHCRVFTNRTLNKIFQVFLSFSYGHPVSSYVPGHNLSHHKHTQTPRDIMRTQKVQHSWNFLNLLLFQPTVAPAVLKADIRYLWKQLKDGRPHGVQCAIEYFVVITLKIFLAYLDWRKYLLFIHAPHFWGQYGIVTVNLLQHDGCDVVEESGMKKRVDIKAVANTARNFTGKTLNWLALNNGYHTIHHMYPTLHWSLCPEEHDKQVKPHMDKRLEEKNILTYIFRAFIYPGVRVDYRGQPISYPPNVPDEDWISYNTKYNIKDDGELQEKGLDG
eukprot:CAMPEP_0113874744 /NCGR_PEP_ID=MMETSP0780_2-20120614/4512_1 /TAXON_ID=652834 /ORGANISM="Palpitomonas bilix" /LENGTH=336 /DNA_ID=CAMNT_0000860567 /DNA_START=40 /DNA_END=1050 /DNA_ORIENTATION=- /assembly_acc=CAM_ASM_000599